MPEADNYTKEDLDNYLTARVLLLARELNLMGTVKQLKRDANGNTVGVSHFNQSYTHANMRCILLMEKSKNIQQT